MAEAKRGGTERTGANAKTIRKRSQNHDTYKSIVFLPDTVGGGTVVCRLHDLSHR